MCFFFFIYFRQFVSLLLCLFFFFSLNSSYKDTGWTSWGDWLGTDVIAPQNRSYLSFEEARDFAHKLQLKSKQEWVNWTKSKDKLNEIPANPARSYKDTGWISWGDWLGTDTIAPQNRSYLSFEEARDFVHKLQLKSSKEWSDWTKSGKKPDDIPADPRTVYIDNGWIDMGDWLGNGVVATFNRDYLSFEDARIFVHQLQFKNGKEWLKWIKSGTKPDNIPADPSGVYKDEGWQGMGDWLGTGVIATHQRQYLPFDEARDLVRQLNLKNKEEWIAWAKSNEKPNNIPASPDGIYKDKGWLGWGDWIGNTKHWT